MARQQRRSANHFARPFIFILPLDMVSYFLEEIAKISIEGPKTGNDKCDGAGWTCSKQRARTRIEFSRSFNLSGGLVSRAAERRRYVSYLSAHFFRVLAKRSHLPLFMDVAPLRNARGWPARLDDIAGNRHANCIAVGFDRSVLGHPSPHNLSPCIEASNGLAGRYAVQGSMLTAGTLIGFWSLTTFNLSPGSTSGGSVADLRHESPFKPTPLFRQRRPRRTRLFRRVLHSSRAVVSRQASRSRQICFAPVRSK
ncbi:hypothetical protein AF71_00059860 [Rhizobium sp. 57MFTsu3.2]|nr:hypothetical protein [Rhizobium sp. 57MFTsu3.2]